MSTIIHIPTYASDQFIDRTDEVDFVKKLIQDKQKGQEADTLAVRVNCERGSGKTWFSFHLKRSVFPQTRNVKSLLFCFSPVAKLPEMDESTEYIWRQGRKKIGRSDEPVSWLVSALEARQGNNADLPEMHNWILNKINKMPAEQLLVVILDSLFDLDEKFQKQLEEELLKPLLESKRALLVMTGRGMPITFKSPALRLHAQQLKLSPFPDEFATEQIQKLQEVLSEKDNPYSLPEILEIAQGYPLVIALLVQGYELDRVVQVLLSEEITAAQRRMLEALCPLEEFSDEVFEPMLKARGGILKEGWTLNDIREKVRDPLVASQFMINTGVIFYLDQNIRHVLCEYLRRCKPDVWQRLNHAASEFYQAAAQNKLYKRQQTEYQELALKYQNECERIKKN